jgi:ArsR family transcriptional regulator, arsenate/arsenite/antimonite-responsive transcriptional repressor
MPDTLASDSPVLQQNEVCCPPLLTNVVSDEDAVQAAQVFKALADPARVRLISTIAASGDDGACVCELVEPLGLSQPTVSHHLKILYETGLISREKRGTWAYYRLRQEAASVIALALRC